MRPFVLLVIVAVLAVGLGWVLRGCGAEPAETGRAGQRSTGEAVEGLWYCPMHPQVTSPGSGTCGLCGMDLVAPSVGEDPGPRRFAMSEAAVKLAEVVTVPVERKFVTADVRLVGKVDFDETRVKTISAWVPGRLERLFVDYTGVTVQEGDHLVLLYSAELMTAQVALLEALKAVETGAREPSEFLRESDRRSLESAREKLRLWGLSQEQIEEIEARGTPDVHTLINSPTEGIVIHKGKNVGDFVETGTKIYTIADLGHLWVRLDAYESDLPWIRYGQKVTLETEAYPGERFEGWISFIDPLLDEHTRTVKVRVNVDNGDGRLKPGMFVRASVHSRLAQAGRVMDPRLAGKWICPMHPEVQGDGEGDCSVCGMPLEKAEDLGFVEVSERAQKPLVVPASAVLVTGRRGVVYVEVPYAQRPTYEGREVVLGPRARDHYIVVSGLSEGDRVVVHGNFKIDSALQIQAKPSMMSMLGDTTPLQGKALTAFRESVATLFENYFAAHMALGGDDLEGATQAMTKLAAIVAAVPPPSSDRAIEAWLDVVVDLDEAIEKIQDSTSIEALREAFRPFAGGMIELERVFGHAGDAVHVEVHCPMAFESGASWLQVGEKKLNPYHGSSMLRCGTVTRVFGSAGEDR